MGNAFREITVKLEMRKFLVIVVGGNLTEIRPLLTLPQKWRNFKNGDHQQRRLWEILSQKWRFWKIFSEKPRKIVKSENRKSLVIVAGGNLAGTRPLLTIPQKWRNFKKMGGHQK